MANVDSTQRVAIDAELWRQFDASPESQIFPVQYIDGACGPRTIYCVRRRTEVLTDRGWQPHVPGEATPKDYPKVFNTAKAAWDALNALDAVSKDT